MLFVVLCFQMPARLQRLRVGADGWIDRARRRGASSFGTAGASKLGAGSGGGGGGLNRDPPTRLFGICAPAIGTANSAQATAHIKSGNRFIDHTS